MGANWIVVPGILVRGYGVASGPSPEYPYSALERQIPIFAARGLDLSDCFLGTLNVDIRPVRWQLRQAEFTFHDVRWTDLHPPEHFSFSRCQVAYAKKRYPGWIYFPHPETKLHHFQNASLVEVIAHRIPGVVPGAQLELILNADRVAIEPGEGG